MTRAGYSTGSPAGPRPSRLSEDGTRGGIPRVSTGPRPGIFARMTDDGLAGFYRRYNACCNEHRFEDLPQFVAHDVVINGTDRGLDMYAENLRYVVRGFPDYHWELRHLLADPPWIAVHLDDTGTHRGQFLGVPATGRSVSTREFAFYRIDADRIAEVWGTAFGEELLQQVRNHRPDPPVPPER
jgi:predicted ester cyclase